MIHQIRRSYLLRQIETYDVDLPDDADPVHLIRDHHDEFNADLTNMIYGVPTSIELEELEYDELTLTVVDRQSAKVIPMRRKT